MSRILLLLTLLVAASLAQRKRITQLPGLTFQPSFSQYSGYLNGSGGRQLFYWLVEASEADKETAPLLLWVNGGPGCSSIGGLLMSNGPFLADSQAKLRQHPLAWNRLANVLYIDSPAGVGLSDPLLSVNKGDLNDNNTIMAKMQALSHFYKLFPEYVGRDFFIAGESYAGFYIPLLASAILDSKLYPEIAALRAVAIGNGLFVSPANPLLHAERKRYAKIMGINTNDSMLNMYNCAHPCYRPKADIGEYYPCLNSSGLTAYLNDPAVREALGVRPQVPKYSICNYTAVFNNFDFRNVSMLPVILRVMSANIRVTIYHGHLDLLIPFGVVEKTLQQGGQLKQDTQEMDTWYYCRSWSGEPSRQLGGIQRSYRNSSLIVRSVIGAGHSVATDLPEAAFQILKDLLSNSDNENELYGVRRSCPAAAAAAAASAR